MKPTLTAFTSVEGHLLDGDHRSRLGPVDMLEINGNEMTLYFRVDRTDWDAIADRETRIETRLGPRTMFTTRLEAQGRSVLRSETLHVIQVIAIHGPKR
jgi:hypothetical protein